MRKNAFCTHFDQQAGPGAGTALLPYLALLRAGFASRRHRCRRGGLLPHLFTLTAGRRPGS